MSVEGRPDEERSAPDPACRLDAGVTLFDTAVCLPCFSISSVFDHTHNTSQT